MKAEVSLLLFGFTLNLCAQSQVATTAANGTATNSEPPALTAAYSVTSRGPNNRVWQRAITTTNDAGETATVTNSYTELGTGLQFWDGTQWADSSDLIQITPNGAAATTSQHQVSFANNINTAGSIDLAMPDGRHLRSQIVGLAYYDEATSNSVLFAETKDSIGQLLQSSNQVVYTNAFTDFQADVRYAHTKGKFEQDVILRSQPPSPAQYGLNPQSTLIEIWTEFLNPVEPIVTEKEIIVQGEGIRQTCPDQNLDFGSMQVGRGTAFATDSEIDLMGAVSVVKKWVHVEGRTFLVEQIPFAAVAQELQRLPPTASSGTNGPSGSGSPGASLRIKLPAAKLQAKVRRPLLLAKEPESKFRPGFVMDYNIVNSTLTNFTFQGDTTYFISIPVDFYGTNTIEGGAVIKCAPTSGGNTFHDTFVSLTAPYRPAIFTAANDDSVGTALTNGTVATNVIVTTYLSIPDGGSVTNMRFSYAYNALGGWNGDVEVSDCQFIDCDHPITINSSTTNLGLHNVLITMTNFNGIPNFCSCQAGALVSYSQAVKIYGENVTMDLDSHNLMTYFMTLYTPSNTTVNFTNSILICTNLNAYYWTSYGSGLVGVTANTNSSFYATNMPSGLFTNVGAGNYYLASGSSCRTNGNPNISAGLIADLGRKTTFPPVLYSNQTFLTNTTLSPQARRDNGSNPDLGYHYDPLDYILDLYTVSNAVVTLTNGVAIGVFDDSAGIWLQDGSSLVSQGTPTSPNWMVQYQGVQEQSVSIGSDTPSTAIFLNTVHYTGNAPNITCLFTKFVGEGQYLNEYQTSPGNINSLLLQNCEFWAGSSEFNGQSNSSAIIENNLFVRSVPNVDMYPSLSLAFSNNLIWGATFDFLRSRGGGSLYAFNNSFDTCTLNTNSSGFSNGYNAYLNTTTIMAPTIGTNVVSGSSLAYQQGALGDFYQPANSPLIDQGSTNAAVLGFYHYTTQTNQLKETNSVVDIGYHYVAVDGSGNPLDFNENGIPDYLESPYGPVPPGLVLVSSTNHYLIGAAPTNIDRSAMILDEGCANYNGGSLAVSFASGWETNDTLGINNQGTNAGQIGLTNSNVTFGGTNIGTFTLGTSNLSVSFNSNAIPASAQALLTNITFHYYPGATEYTSFRTIQFVLTNGCGQASTPATETINMDCPSSLEVVLLIDCSPSMTDTYNGTQRKIDAAKAAAANFVNSLQLTNDKVALVTFSQDATNNAVMTTNLSLIVSNITNLDAGSVGETAMSNGVAAAQTNFPSGPDSALRIIIMLTDGAPNLPGTTTNDANLAALNAATTVKQAGIRFVAIGVGTIGVDLYPDLLIAMASSSNDYYFASNTAVLQPIYTSIAESFCRAQEPPTVTLTSPANNSYYSPDSNVLFSATTTVATNRTISQVQFWDNGTNNVGIVTNSPYQLILPFLPTGTNQITAVAKDSGGLSGTSAVATVIVYARPVVTILSPTNNSSFSGTTNLLITAYATNIGVGISNVAFFCYTNSWGNGTKSNSNYVITNNLVPGVYPVTAVATDSNGVRGWSAITLIKVNSTNTPPSVAIIYPTSGQLFDADPDITITATATNTGTSVTNVEFFVNGQSIGSDTNAPYNMKVCCWKPGTYALIARATDSNGTSSNSIPVMITVGAGALSNKGFWDPSFTNIPYLDAYTEDSAQTVVLALTSSNQNVYIATGNPLRTNYLDQVFDTNSSSLGPMATGILLDTILEHPRSLVWDGTEIFASGDMTDRDLGGLWPGVLSWDGSSWNQVDNSLIYNPGFSGSSVYQLMNALIGAGIGGTEIATSLPVLGLVGSDLYVGGNFISTSDTRITNIAKLNRATMTWEPIGNGLNGPVYAICSYGDSLIIGGAFTNAGGNPNANHIAMLVGNTWTNLGTGVSGQDWVNCDLSPTNQACPVDITVWALAGCGSNLYAGGDFTSAGGNPNANGIGVWNGVAWGSLGHGLTPLVNASNGTNADGSFADFSVPAVYSIVPHGNTVYVGGAFGGAEDANGHQTTALSIAQATWDEALQSWSWSDLDLGVDSDYLNFDSAPFGTGVGVVSAMTLAEGSRSNSYDLYIAGFFKEAGSGDILSDTGMFDPGPYVSIARWRVGYPLPTNAPVVAITAPAAYSVFSTNSTVSMTATATSSYTNIANVVFQIDNTLSTNGTPPASGNIWSATYEPTNNGVHFIQASATDGNGLVGNSQSVAILVKATNGPVTALSDFYTIYAGNSGVSLNVLTNDSDSLGRPLKISQVIQPHANLGQVSISRDKTHLVYNSMANVFGTDYFWYSVNNSNGDTDLAAVTVNILALPTVHITSPTDQQRVPASVLPLAVNVFASAAGGGIAITNIELITISTNSLTTTNHAPTGGNYTFNWTNAVPGWYTFIAVATDQYGSTNASAPVSVALYNTNETGHTVIAAIANLNPNPTSGGVLDDIGDPVVTNGIFDLQGTAADSVSTNPVSYRVLVYVPDQNIDASADDPAAAYAAGPPLVDVTPGPLNSQGFHIGGDSSGNLGNLSFSIIPNGTYKLVLQVRGGTEVTNTIAEFVLESQLKVGQFSFSEQDISLPVNGIPISIVRTYNSLNNYAGDFGYDWTFALNSMDIQLNETRTDVQMGQDGLSGDDSDAFGGPPKTVSIRTGGGRDVTLTLPDGRRTTFTYVPRYGAISYVYYAEWQATPGARATLQTSGDDIINIFPRLEWQEGADDSNYENHDVPGWVLTTQDGTKYNITRGPVTNIVYDPDGSGTNYYVQVYGTPKLTSIVQTNGESLVITDTNVTHFTSNGLPTRSIYFDRDGVGRIVAVYDQVGGTSGYPVLQYVYDQNTSNLLQVLKLTDRDAGSYTTNKYHYDNPNFPHFITSIESPTGAPLARNEYDDSGKLIAVVDAQGNTTQFLHDTTNQLEAVTDRLTNTTYYTYDSQGNVTAQTNALNEVARYGYDSQNNKTNQITGYINGSGIFVALQTNSSTFDGNGYMLSSTDAMNRTSQFTYDGSGNTLTQTDPIGNVVGNSYDSGGNLTGTVQFDTNGAIVGASSSVYSGNLLSQTFDANGNTNASFGYDSSQNLTNSTDARGFSHGFAYDDNGNQTGSTYAYLAGGTTTYVSTSTDYDAQNRPYHTVDTFSNETFTYYNSLGKTDHTVDRFGNTNSYLYDDSGNLIQIIDGAGLITRTVYDVAGRPFLTTDRSGITGTLTAYDAAGRVTNTIRLTGVWVDIVTNAPSSYSTEVTSNGTPYSTNSTTYFSTGWVKSRTKPDGQTTTYDYWPDGQVKTVTDPLTNVTQFAYDNAGRQQQIQDARNHTIQFQYDAVGRLVTTIYNNLSSTSNTFNTLGQRTAIQDQAGLQTQFGFDISGTLTNVVKPQVPNPENGNSLTNTSWAYTYDTYGRTIVTTDPKGRTNTTSYDAYGRRIAQQLQLGQTNWTVYYTNGNNNGMLWRQYDFLGQRTEFAYDNFGRVKAKFLFSAGGTYPSNAICYKYNQLSQLTQITERSGGDASTNACDGYTALFGRPNDTAQAGVGLLALLGRIPPQTSAMVLAFGLFAGILLLVPREKRNEFVACFVATWRAWDVPIKPVRRRLRLPCLSWKVVTYLVIFALFITDDRLNFMRLAKADCSIPANSSTATTRITQYAYDNDGHLTQINAPEGVINYEYDAATGRHTRTCTTNSDISYQYDQLGRLHTVTVNKRNGTTLGAPEVSTYTYDEVGNRKTLSLPNGIVTTYTYDDLNRLTNMSSLNGTTNIATYTYQLDVTGRRTNAVEALREEDGTYLTNKLNWQYDGMYRLTNETSASTSASGNYTNIFSYDLVGNRLKQTHIFGTNTTTADGVFDGNDALLDETNKVNGGMTGTNTYAYDANGSMTNRIQGGITYIQQYDLKNKLSQVTIGGATTAYLYNDSGVRVRSTSTTSTNLYLIDPNNHTGYAQILEEFNAVGGTPTTSYVIGDTVLGQCGLTYTTPSYRLADGHGNTRQMANLSGGVTSRYNYEDYGTLLGSSSSAPETNLRYCGEQFDSTLNTYNLRARFYDPVNGRFNARDSFSGKDEDPESLHKYLYSCDNPVNNIDPSGHGIFAIIILLVVIVIAIAVITFGPTILNEHNGTKPTAFQMALITAALALLPAARSSMPGAEQSYFDAAAKAQFLTFSDPRPKADFSYARPYGNLYAPIIHLNDTLAFTLEPHLLAADIVHETVHTTQYTLSEKSTEPLAYQVESDTLRAFGITGTDSDLALKFPGASNAKFIYTDALRFQKYSITNPAIMPDPQQ